MRNHCMRTLAAGYTEWMDTEKKIMDTKELGRLSHRSAYCRLALTD